MGRKIFNLKGEITRYEDFIEQVMIKNGGFAPLKLLYEEKWKYIDKNSVLGKSSNKTIQEKVQRLNKFTRIASGMYALTDFVKKIEENNDEFLIIKQDKVFDMYKHNRKLGIQKKIIYNSFRIFLKQK